MELVSPQAAGPRQSDRRLWLGYAGLCAVCWLLYAVAGTEWLRGSLRLWDAMYEATWNLAPPMLLGLLALPWLRLLQRRFPLGWPKLLAHTLAAIVFAMLWQAIDFALALWLFGSDHARATLEQRVLWLTIWAVVVYTALVLGFGGALNARRAHAAALTAAQAEAALVRAELAAISGKLNPHFLFNTLNSLVFLVRKDAAVAEQSLLRFSAMMRYLLDTQRDTGRPRLRDELDFVRDYLALESLRLGTRLRIEWQIDPATLDDELPPLTLQPLVENCILHGIAPRLAGGTVRIEAERRLQPSALVLRVADDGAGCTWPVPAAEGRRQGVGLSALRRRFELDYAGQARMSVHSAPGAGFRVEITIPQPQPSP
jgi:signal transduction histidine kinase